MVVGFVIGLLCGLLVAFGVGSYYRQRVRYLKSREGELIDSIFKLSQPHDTPMPKRPLTMWD